MKVKRVIILTDSLGFPREIPESVEYQETYTYLLKEEFPEIEFIQASYGGATIENLYLQSEYLVYFKPDLVILQCGIVDCAPRALTKFEIEFIKRLPIISGVVSKYFKNRSAKLRKRRKISYTTKENYRKFTEKMRSIYGESRVFALGIVPAKTDYEANVYGITKSIENYNELLKDVFGSFFIDTSEVVDKGVMTDYHHLNKEGHQLIYLKLKELF